MQTITIYGASDDLVEVDGNVKGCDEYYYSEAVIVLEPTQDRFRIKYDGVWRVSYEHVTGLLRYHVELAPEDDEDNYTDKATVSGDIARVTVYSSWPVSSGEIRRRVEERFDRGLTDAQCAVVWEALGRP
jgi:hypothetical protein